MFVASRASVFLGERHGQQQRRFRERTHVERHTLARQHLLVGLPFIADGQDRAVGIAFA
jgi:hypothetical protein